MRFRRLVATLWLLGGLVLLFAAFRTTPRNTGYLVLGVLLTMFGAASLRRSRSL